MVELIDPLLGLDDGLLIWEELGIDLVRKEKIKNAQRCFAKEKSMKKH